MKVRKYLLFIFILFGLFGISFSQAFNPALDDSDLVAAVDEEDMVSFNNLVANSKEQERNRAYLAAAKKCNVKMAEILIDEGIDPDELSIYDVKEKQYGEFVFVKHSRSEAKPAPLLAIEAGCDDKVVEFFLNQGHISQHFSYAVINGDMDAVKKIKDIGGNDISLDCDDGDDNVINEILRAAAEYDLNNSTTKMFDVVKDVDIDMNCGVSLMLFNKNFKDIKNALHYIAGKVDIDLNYKWRNAYTTGWVINDRYIKAREKGEIFKLLVNNASNLSEKDEDGNTALLRHINDQEDYVLALIPDEGAKTEDEIAAYLNVKNKDGKTACDLEKEKEQPREAVLEKICTDYVNEQVKDALKREFDN